MKTNSENVNIFLKLFITWPTDDEMMWQLRKKSSSGAKKKQEMNTTADTNRETGGSSQARNHRRIRFSRMSPSVGRMSFLDRGS